MLALLLAPVYLVLNAYLSRWLLRWMAACTHWFKKKWAVGCIMAFYIFVSLSPLTGFLITQGPVHRFLKLLGNYWLGTLAYILLTVLVLDAVRLIWKRTRWGAKGLRHPRRAFVAAGGFVILFVAGISAWGILHAQNVVLREETVTVHKACAAARQGELRIALVSDLHLGYNVGAAQVRRVVETVNETQPDVVVLAGDVFDNEYAAVYQPEKIAALLRGIRSRFGVYACWGNHDVSEQLWLAFLSRPPRTRPTVRFFKMQGCSFWRTRACWWKTPFTLWAGKTRSARKSWGKAGFPRRSFWPGWTPKSLFSS